MNHPRPIVARAWRRLIRRCENESGQGLAEYTLLLGLITLVCIAAVTALGQAVANSVAWTIP